MEEQRTPDNPARDRGNRAQPPGGRGGSVGWWRKIGRWFLVLLAVGGGLAVIVHWSLEGTISEEAIVRFVDRFQVWAPLTYLLLFATLGSFFIPTTVFVIIGVVLFGRLVGFLYSVVGGFLALIVGFSAARTLGREWISRWLRRSSSRLLRLDQALEKHGIVTSMFVRLVYLPNGVINATFGLSGIRMSHYALGSLFGHIPIAFAVAFMADGIKEAWLHSDWKVLLTGEMLAGILVFAFCVATPFVAKWASRRWGSSAADRFGLATMGRLVEQQKQRKAGQGSGASPSSEARTPAGERQIPQEEVAQAAAPEEDTSEQ
ncbi:MAG: TVP38/TMEM64 family protein [Bradymonadales bacterium]|nr:TVP38/TMEM64 family protein [Bradymonadales bacterium]